MQPDRVPTGEVVLHDDAEVYESAPTVPVQPPAAVAKLADWLAEARAAAALAASLSKTSFVPRHFQGKPEETTAAILTGHELGLSPLAALRSIFVIGGTPGMYARTMVALVQSHGHEVWTEDQSDESVTVCGQRKGSSHVERSTWDRARAVKAKLTSNAKYQEAPQQMLYARAASETCRKVAPDVLLGIPYSVEELEDIPAPPQRPTGRPSPVRGGLRVVDAETVPEKPEQPAIEPPRGDITPAQQRKLHADLNELGRGERAAGLELISGILERPVTSTKTLSKADAGTVINALEAMLADRAKAPEPGLDDWPTTASVPGGE